MSLSENMVQHCSTLHAGPIYCIVLVIIAHICHIIKFCYKVIKAVVPIPDERASPLPVDDQKQVIVL